MALNKTYSIIRYYQRPGYRPQVMQTGLSLNDAQAHCNDPETSSSTATSAEARAYTRQHGPWFDGYTQEN